MIYYNINSINKNISKKWNHIEKTKGEKKNEEDFKQLQRLLLFR